MSRKEIEDRILKIENSIFYEKMAENADMSYIHDLQIELRELRKELEGLCDGK